MNRNITNAIRIAMDEWLPPVIRDNKYFMYPLFWYWFNGKNIKTIMEFKSLFHNMTKEEYEKVYKELDCKAITRKSDLNDACIDHLITELTKDGVDRQILEVGCGRGYLLELLSARNFTNLTGSDLRRDFEIEGVKFEEANIEELPFADNSYEITVCNHTLEHIPNLRQAFNELVRVTKNKLYITVPCQRYYYYSLDLHIHYFPVESSLVNTLGVTDHYRCFKLHGDWVLEIDIDKLKAGK